MRKLFLLLILIPLISSCDADVINKLTGYGEKKKETVEEKKKKAKNMLDEVSGMLMIDTSNELIKDEFEEIEPKDVEEIVIDSLETEPFDIFDYEEDYEMIKERNILSILVNKRGQILANDELLGIYNLSDVIINFIDNGGGSNGEDWIERSIMGVFDDGEEVWVAEKNYYGNECSYCIGNRDYSLSENPGKAIINYKFEEGLDPKIAQEVLTIIDDAYTELRNRHALDWFNFKSGISYSDMMEDYYDPYWEGNRSALKSHIYYLRSLYPKQITDDIWIRALSPSPLLQFEPPPPPPPLPELIEDEEEIEEETIIEYDELIGEEVVEVPFAVIENVPVFPGCERGNNEKKRKCMSDKIARFVQKRFNTDLAGDLGLTGRQRISVIFKIDKSGNVTGVRARAPHPILEKEAQRVISLLPKMQPGKQRGKTVIVPYALPIIFQVQD